MLGGKVYREQITAQIQARQGMRGFARGAYCKVRNPTQNASMTPYCDVYPPLFYILSGASIKIRLRPFFKTCFTAAVKLSRAALSSLLPVMILCAK